MTTEMSPLTIPTTPSIDGSQANILWNARLESLTQAWYDDKPVFISPRVQRIFPADMKYFRLTLLILLV